jgi:hypothetical protein
VSNPEALISTIYEHLDSGSVDRAVIGCLKLSRSISDHFSAVMFLREFGPDRRQFNQEFIKEVEGLTKEAQKYIWDKTGEDWLEEHTANFPVNPERPDATVLALGIGR